MNRLYTHYGGHVENLNAALRYNSFYDAREALSLLHSDGVAQVMSFMSERSLKNAALTLSAASPEMRLDVGALVNPLSFYSDCVQARVIERRLVFCIYAANGRTTSPALLNSLWWAERRGMALKLHADDPCSDLLKLLSDRLRSRVEALHISVLERTLCAHLLSPKKKNVATLCDGRCGTLLCALPTFPNLTCLSIGRLRVNSIDCIDAAVLRVLSVAAEMQISDIRLRSVEFSRDFSTLPLSPRLCRLIVQDCEIQSVAGLERCPMLTCLIISANWSLRSLHGIAGAPSLEKIVTFNCNIEDVEGLSQCPKLREVDISFSNVLHSLRGLAGAPRLEKVAAFQSRVQDVDDLNQCSQLREVDVSYNHPLRSLRGLAGAPRLEKVLAKFCNLQDVDALGQCPHLREVDVSYSRQLRSLRGLAGAPRLEKVLAKFCGLQEVKGLSQCPQLREIDISGNNDLRSLHGLAGAPSLEKIVADKCNLQDVDKLSRCLKLKEINVSENGAPLDLRDLTGASNLQQITAKDCALLGAKELRSRLPSCKLIL